MTQISKNKKVVAGFGIWVLIIISFLGDGLGTNTLAQEPWRNERALDEKALNGINIPDRRRIVSDSERIKFPFTAIVKIKVKFSDGTYWGSGAMIGPNRVLTAEHNVYDKATDEHASITVIPAYSDGYAPFGEIKVKEFEHGTHAGCHDGANCDIAVLTLAQNIGNKTGWFGFREFSSNSMSNVFMVGYPKDRGNGESMYMLKTTATKQSDGTYHNALSYQDWTYGGMSGGPIFTSDNYIVEYIQAEVTQQITE